MAREVREQHLQGRFKTLWVEEKERLVAKYFGDKDLEGKEGTARAPFRLHTLSDNSLNILGIFSWDKGIFWLISKKMVDFLFLWQIYFFRLTLFNPLEKKQRYR